MFKNAGSVEIKSLAGDAIVSMESFGRKYGGMPREQMIERLMGKPASYTRAEAETLAKKFENIKGGGRIKPDPVPPHPDPVPLKPDPVPPVWWERIKDFPYKKAIKYLLGAGLLYWLWKWLTSDEASPFPACLRGKLSGDDASLIQQRGLDNALIITKTGNADIDAAGGGIFYDDGKFESMNGRYKGNWTGEGPITLTIGDKSYTIECGGSPVPPPPPVPPKPGKCKPCGNFPFTTWCKNDKIRDIQSCIGAKADGCIGPETEGKLRDKGYSTTITKDVYDKIMKDCGKSTTDTDSSIVPDAEQSTEI